MANKKSKDGTLKVVHSHKIPMSIDQPYARTSTINDQSCDNHQNEFVVTINAAIYICSQICNAIFNTPSETRMDSVCMHEFIEVRILLEEILNKIPPYRSVFKIKVICSATTLDFIKHIAELCDRASQKKDNDYELAREILFLIRELYYFMPIKVHDDIYKLMYCPFADSLLLPNLDEDFYNLILKYNGEDDFFSPLTTRLFWMNCQV